MVIGSQKQQILDRLSTYNYNTAWTRVFKKQQRSTAKWITVSMKFGDWKSHTKRAPLHNKKISIN